MSIGNLIVYYLLIFFSAIFLTLSIHNFIRFWRKKISDFRFVKNFICSFFLVQASTILEGSENEQYRSLLIISSLFVTSVLLFCFFERYYLVSHAKYSISDRNSSSLKKKIKEIRYKLLEIFFGIVGASLMAFLIVEKWSWMEVAATVVLTLAGICFSKWFEKVFEIFWIRRLGKATDK